MSDPAKNAWAAYFAASSEKGENHPDAVSALKEVRKIRDAQTAQMQQESGKDEWRDALSGLLQQYPDAKITVKPHGTSTEKLRALGRNEATKNRVDGYSDSFRQPTKMRPAMIHREKALMSKNKGPQSSGTQKGRHARWMADLQRLHPENHARLQADYEKRRAASERDLLVRKEAHAESLKKLDAIAEQYTREKVDGIHGASTSRQAKPALPEIDAFRVNKQNRDDPEFPISGEDHKNQRPSLDVPTPKPESPFQAERRKHKARVEPIGYVWLGSKTHSIYSGLPAEHVDHCPALDYIVKRQYPKTGPRHYVAATAMENLTKARYWSACICEAAAKIHRHLTERKRYAGNDTAARTARLIQSKWSTSTECPCVLCAASQPLQRWKDCQETAHVTKKMPHK